MRIFYGRAGNQVLETKKELEGKLEGLQMANEERSKELERLRGGGDAPTTKSAGPTTARSSIHATTETTGPVKRPDANGNSTDDFMATIEAEASTEPQPSSFRAASRSSTQQHPPFLALPGRSLPSPSHHFLVLSPTPLPAPPLSARPFLRHPPPFFPLFRPVTCSSGGCVPFVDLDSDYDFDPKSQDSEAQTSVQPSL